MQMNYGVCISLFIGLPAVFSAVIPDKPRVQKTKIHTVNADEISSKSSRIFSPKDIPVNLFRNAQSTVNLKLSSSPPTVETIRSTTAGDNEKREKDAKSLTMRTKSSSYPGDSIFDLIGSINYQDQFKSHLIDNIFTEMQFIETLRNEILIKESDAIRNKPENCITDKDLADLQLNMVDQVPSPSTESIISGKEINDHNKEIVGGNFHRRSPSKKHYEKGRSKRHAGKQCVPDEHRADDRRWIRTLLVEELKEVLTCLVEIKTWIQCNCLTKAIFENITDRTASDLKAKDMMILG
ncbi:histone-lysine N-methyltransferase ehmt2 [Plakobranchus ocellatus]|uniref:Histone-lysine N-methyltransferase ehmt2 n=1 Tax=Plakobranchus ocellatus TaxID=259542 RepID=A0AAV4AHV2_9GAST|nr:histone-lysine N-methyltransferase ehmt2 [Plakobranchus ocellatus]